MVRINYISMAMASIRVSKIRTFMTMLGIIVSVASIVTIVSLGEGVKNQLSEQLSQTDKNLVTIRGGNLGVNNSPDSTIDVATLLLNPKNLNATDSSVLEKLPEVDYVTTFTLLDGHPNSLEGHGTASDIEVVATSLNAQKIIGQKMLHGGFFQDNDYSIPTAVIGRNVAERYFKSNTPIGQKFTFGGQQITVSGVIQEFSTNPFLSGVDYNNTIFLPISFAQSISKEPLEPFQILVQPKPEVSADNLDSKIRSAMSANHPDQGDFTILRIDDINYLASKMSASFNKFAAVITGIMLLIGGVGIMNIMLVSVSERMQEIGVRKSVGATNRQIMGQFVAEAVMISLIGGLIGLVISLLANYAIRLTTNLTPVIYLPIMVIALITAVIVGVVFGTIPALKAARKDPIMALRRF